MATATGLVLALGLCTPLVGAALAVLILAAQVFTVPSPFAPIAGHVFLDALALALLGPGGYSLDARLFGRREVLVSHEPRR